MTSTKVANCVVELPGEADSFDGICDCFAKSRRTLASVGVGLEARVASRRGALRVEFCGGFARPNRWPELGIWKGQFLCGRSDAKGRSFPALPALCCHDEGGDGRCQLKQGGREYTACCSLKCCFF